MKAWVLHTTTFGIEEVANPVLNENQALIRIKYAALNHRDEWIRQGQYAKIQLPAILGSDASGVVEQVADKKNERWLGKEVIINPNQNWGDNPRVQSKNYQILGMPSQGTLAQYLVCDVDRLAERPTHLTMKQSAALPLAGLTAFNACFNKGKIENGMNVLISGVGGGVAQFAFLYAVAVGANSYVSSSKEDVIEQCKILGAKGGANYMKENALKELAKEIGGFDVIIDAACGDGMNDLIAALQPTGRYVFYGATRGLPKALNMRQIFWNQLEILGSTMGSDEDFQLMTAFVNQHKIIPIIDKAFPFAAADLAFERMRTGQQFGKIIVQVDE